jgi:hypothetical protein
MIENIDWRIRKEIQENRDLANFLKWEHYFGPELKEKENEMDKLYGWLFTFNSLNGKWKATTRDFYPELFCGNKGNVLESSSIDTLIELISRTEGDKTKLNQLVNDNG